jgi:putative acetyltransferase
VIRYAHPADHAGIEALLAAAFRHPDEAALVARLRADEDALFELITEDDGDLVGHILFSRLWVDRFELYGALAPLAVHPDRHRQGLGAKLVRAGLESARELGCYGVQVLGDPDYYGRFGFTADAAREIISPYRGLAAFQALALEEDAFACAMGVTYPNAFATPRAL